MLLVQLLPLPLPLLLLPPKKTIYLLYRGCGASKTTTILNCIARGAMWKPWDGGIYLVAPTRLNR
jgi:hypothetical protein